MIRSPNSFVRLIAVVVALALSAVLAPPSHAALSSTVTARFQNAVLDPDSTAALANVQSCGGAAQSGCPSGFGPIGVSWGSSGRSRLLFAPESQSSILAPPNGAKRFDVGTLTHVNEVVAFFSTISDVDFALSVQIVDSDRNATITVGGVARLGIVETDNTGLSCSLGGTPPNCLDRLEFRPPFFQGSFDAGNVVYELDQLRFEGQGANSTVSVLTDENASTPIGLSARITRTSRVLADAGPDQTIDEATTVNLDGTASEVSGLTYQWTQISGPSVVLNNPTSPTPSFTAPELTDDASIVFELRVKDAIEDHPELTDTDRVRINIKDINDPPVADPAGPYVVNEGASVVLDGSDSSDPDGQPLTYAWDYDADGSVDATGVTPTFDAALRDGPLTVPVELEVCDTFAVCNTKATVVEVRNVAPSPTIDQPNIVDEGSSITLGSTATDPAPADEVVLTFDWDLNNDGVFGDHLGPSPTLTPPDGPTTIPVAVEVCDDDGGCTIATGSVDVRNVAPSVDVGPDRVVYRNDVVDMTATFNDPGQAFDNPYGYEWSGDAPFVTEAGSTAFGDSITTTTTYPIEGFYGVALEVTDKDGAVGGDDLVIEVLNKPPMCSDAGPSIPELWPPNHKFRSVSIEGLTDPEGDDLVTTITSIYQDEEVGALGSGPNSTPDGQGVGTAIAELKAERAGPQDSRFYHVSFLVDDGHGGQCTGTVQVVVPHDRGINTLPFDGGPLYDSTQLN